MIAEIINKVAGMGWEEGKYFPRPSLIKNPGEDCLRQLVYWRSGVPRAPLPGRAVLVFDDSSWHEELTLDWLRKTAFKIHSEQMEVECFEVKGKVVKGHIDGIVEDLEGNEFLLEHKAINHFSFHRIDKENLPLGYIAQASAYIKGLQKVAPHIERGILLIKNKNTAQYLEVLFHYDTSFDIATIEKITWSSGEVDECNLSISNLVSDAIKRFEEVEDYAERKILPPRPYPFGTTFPCEYCGWYEVCWKNYEAEIEELEKDVALEEELENAISYFQELKMHKKEIEAQLEDLRKEIVKKLLEKKAQSGKTKNFIVQLKLQKRKILDKSLLSPEIIQIATKEVTSEVLYVKRRDEK